jgi:hypothetical protein
VVDKLENEGDGGWRITERFAVEQLPSTGTLKVF